MKYLFLLRVFVTALSAVLMVPLVIGLALAAVLLVICAAVPLALSVAVGVLAWWLWNQSRAVGRSVVVRLHF